MCGLTFPTSILYGHKHSLIKYLPMTYKVQHITYKIKETIFTLILFKGPQLTLPRIQITVFVCTGHCVLKAHACYPVSSLCSKTSTNSLLVIPPKPFLNFLCVCVCVIHGSFEQIMLYLSFPLQPSVRRPRLLLVRYNKYNHT